MKKIAVLIAVSAWFVYGGGPYWVDKMGKRHNGNIFSYTKAKTYGVDYGRVPHFGYTKIKVRVKVQNHCWRLKKSGDGAWPRSAWKRIDEDTVELFFGKVAAYSADLGIDNDESSAYWDVFGVGDDCSEVPQYEVWTLYKQVGGRWVKVGTQDFVIEP